MHVILVPTVIMLFSYDVFKYKNSSKTYTHRQKRIYTESVGNHQTRFYKRPPHHNRENWPITYVDSKTSFQTFLIPYTQKQMTFVQIGIVCTLSTDRKMCNLALKSGISIRKGLGFFFSRLLWSFTVCCFFLLLLF